MYSNSESKKMRCLIKQKPRELLMNTCAKGNIKESSGEEKLLKLD